MVASNKTWPVYSLSLWLLLAITAFSQTAASTALEQAEPLIRARAAEYLTAYGQGDLEKMAQYWSAQSPHREESLKVFRSQFQRVKQLEVTAPVMTGFQLRETRITMRLFYDLSYVSAFTEQRSELWRAVGKEIEWVEEAGHWNVWREIMLQDRLANQLSAAASAEERARLFAQEPALVGTRLRALLITLGDSKLARENYSAALADYQLAFEVAAQTGDDFGIAGAWLNMARAYHSLGDSTASLEHSQKSLMHRIKANIVNGRELCANKIGQVLMEQGNYREAIAAFQQAIHYAEVNNSNNSRAAIQSLLGIGEVALKQRQPALALTYFSKGEALAKQVGDTISQTDARRLTARAHQQLGNYGEAKEFFLANLRQLENARHTSGLPTAQIDLGVIESLSGELPAALEHFQQALTIAEKINYLPGVKLAKLHLSGIYLRQGKYAEAAALAAPIAQQAQQEKDTDIAINALTMSGVAHRALNQIALSRQALETAVALTEDFRTQFMGNETAQADFFADLLQPYRELVALFAHEQQVEQAFSYAERAKARALLDALTAGKPDIAKAMTTAELQQERKLKDELNNSNTRLRRLAQSGQAQAAQIAELKASVEKTRLAYDLFQAELYTAHPELKIYRGEVPPLKIEEVAAFLPRTDMALLEYVVTENATYLFALTKASANSGVELKAFPLVIKSKELSSLIETYRRQLAEQNLTFHATAKQLYDVLLKPAQAQLAGKTKLIIVPDGKLWELPFQALVTPKNQYLIETAAVSYAPSLTVLREMQAARARRGKPSGDLLAFGNPSFGQETIKRLELAYRDEKLVPLPEAEAEVKAIGQLYGARSQVFIGADAREDRLKSAAATAGVLHIATHGVLNDAAPMYSHLALATNNEKAGDEKEDGLLEAWELMQLDLKADLAVLSACETARGRIGAGEGVIGLSWALFVAGVPSTLVSQWKVESSSTRDLMLGFHRNLKGTNAKPGAPKAEALRQAVLPLLKKPATNHPFYWAGFVLVGDGK